MRDGKGAKQLTSLVRMSTGISRWLRTCLRSSQMKKKKMTPCMQAILFWTLLPKKKMLKLSNNANLISLTKYFR